MHVATLLRYGLWVAIVGTADANRRHYHLTTTWLPHLLTNSLSLLLPDLYRLVAVRPHPPHCPRPTTQLRAERQTIQTVFAQLVHDNPAYVAYVAPLAAGYLLSHPQFNIYKGELGELRFAGFGLDAIPHSTTALALTMLSCDAALVAANNPHAAGLIAQILRWGAQHQVAFSALVLALATVIWEVGEYRIYRHEMAQRGDMRLINMQWSVDDMLTDCASNGLGWILALAWRKLQGSHLATAPAAR